MRRSIGVSVFALVLVGGMLCACSAEESSVVSAVTTIKGVVLGVQANGVRAPLEGANVTARSGRKSEQTVTTGADGTFAFPALAPGKYQLDVSATGYTPAVKRVVLAPDTEVSTNFVLVPRGMTVGVIVGTVYTYPPNSIDRQYVGGATVQLTSGGAEVEQAVTDAAGSFQFAKIPAGTYGVHVEKAPFAPVDTQVTLEGASVGSVSVRLGDVELGSVSGIVYGAQNDGTLTPLEGAAVRLTSGIAYASAPVDGTMVETGADGAFAFNDVEPGYYQLLVTKEAYTTKSTEIVMTPGAIIKQNVVLNRAWVGATVKGTVTEGKLGFFSLGDPIADARVTLESAYVRERNKGVPPCIICPKGTDCYDICIPVPSFETQTDASGAFEFKDVPPAQYRLAVSKDGYFPYEQYLTVRSGVDWDLQIQLDVAVTGKLEGTVAGFSRRSGGTINRLVGAHVVVHTPFLRAANSVASNTDVWLETWTDENGNYTIEDIPVGTYTCEVSMVGYKPQRVTVTIERDQTTEKNFILRKSH